MVGEKAPRKKPPPTKVTLDGSDSDSDNKPFTCGHFPDSSARTGPGELKMISRRKKNPATLSAIEKENRHLLTEIIRVGIRGIRMVPVS